MNKVLSYIFCFFQLLINLSGLYTSKYLSDVNDIYKTSISYSNNLVLCWLFSYFLEFYIIYRSNTLIYKNIRLYIHLSQLFNSLWLLSYLCDDIYLSVINSFILYLIHSFYITKQHILLKENHKLTSSILTYMYFNSAWNSIVFYQNLSVIMLLNNFYNMSIISLFIGFLLSNLYIFGENRTFLITYYIYLLDKIFW